MEVGTGTLDLHFIGGSVGESIVIHFPDGRWAVVDAYTRDLQDDTRNPTVVFLRENNVKELAFVCLTHPHEDHYCGLRQVLQAPDWKVRAFWRSAVLPNPLIKEWREFIIQWQQWQKENGTALEALEASELTELFQHVADSGLVPMRLQFDPQFDASPRLCFPSLDEPPAGYNVYFFAPPVGQLDSYEKEVIRASARPDPTVLYNQANTISAGLVIEYGATRVVLGGDMTRPAWNEVAHRFGGPDCQVDVLKVSHHGSKTGYTEALWQKHCSPDHTVAVVFPFHRHNIPRTDSQGFFKSASASVKYTVHPEPDHSRAAAGPGIADFDSVLVQDKLQVRKEAFASGRWSLKLTSDGAPPSAEKHGDAWEMPT